MVKSGHSGPNVHWYLTVLVVMHERDSCLIVRE